ncbi:MAG: AMP-binding protein, partial [Propionibacteriaceae bacterium]|nr:AMP-binding protein [Propionibacteriaceae bacterium]
MSESTSEFVNPNPPFAYAEGSIDPETFRDAASADPIGFWEDRAKELEWFTPWEKVVDDSKAPFFEWYTGAKTNIVHNAIDRHLSGPYKNKLALIWVGENGSERSYSYFSLNREVISWANVLKSMGVRKGDRVTIYLPRIPEVVFAMLACAKIGAIHSVIFAGFSPDALASRIDHSESKLVITADGSWVNGSIFPLKKIVDEAVRFSASVENILVVKNTGEEINMEPLRDHWYHDLAALPIAHGACETEQMDATDPLFILYTSGSTGTPKAILHAHGGYMVGTYTTLKYTFDIRDEDRWWCSADPGWITGHSYLVYGPLLCGATIFLYEGGPTYPTPDRWWNLIEQYGITTFYTSPTAVRTLLRFGDAWPARHDLSSLRILGTVGEPINPEAWQWLFNVVGQGRCPI